MAKVFALAQDHVRDCLYQMTFDQAVLFILMVAMFDPVFSNELKQEHGWESSQLLSMPREYQDLANDLLECWYLEDRQFDLKFG